jgi:hypothetical protein
MEGRNEDFILGFLQKKRFFREFNILPDFEYTNNGSEVYDVVKKNERDNAQ